MKKNLFFASTATVLLCSALTINAQDIITKRDGSEIKAKVSEVGTNEVKYTRFGTTSPTYTLSKSEIFMIKYEDGEKEIFDKQSNTQQRNRSQYQQEQTQNPNSSKEEQYKKNIVGSFVYIKTEQGEGNALSIEGTETFSENGRVEDSGIITMTFIDANARKVSLKYKLSVRGRYAIKDGYIIYDYNINSVDIQPIYTATTTEAEKQTYTLLEDQLAVMLKESIINGDNNDKILELNDSRLVIENSKGEQSIYKRIKRTFSR